MSSPRDLRIADHTYVLPPERIALRPLAERDASRLLVYRDGSISDRVFRELPEVLPEGALLVVNDTRVVNARLRFVKDTGARIEVFCLEPADGGPVEEAFRQRGSSRWWCTVGNVKRWKDGPLGQLFPHPDGDVQLFATLVERRGLENLVEFSWEPAELSLAEVLHRAGVVPLPPYLHRDAEPADEARYQTVYAREEGSVAAPTAGLHFTPQVLEALDERGIARTHLTLHVGAGTFRPVQAEVMADHEMHRERIVVSRQAIADLVDAVGTHPVVAVGTTSLRTLESLYWHGVALLEGRGGNDLFVEQWEPYDRTGDPPSAKEALEAVLRTMEQADREVLTGSTGLIIAPGYTIRVADALITNFHQPASTLLLLVAAFIGGDWRRIYDHALANDYRFLSYGDSSLLFRSS